MLDDELIERMRGTVDRAEIIECLHTYARAMDRFDRELARSVYHEGATDDHGNFSGPAREFIEWAMTAPGGEFVPRMRSPAPLPATGQISRTSLPADNCRGCAQWRERPLRWRAASRRRCRRRCRVPSRSPMGRTPPRTRKYYKTVGLIIQENVIFPQLCNLSTQHRIQAIIS